MASGLAALLDDIATIAKVAAASIDDVGAAAGRASAKAAGVVIDDTAVAPRFVTGFTPDRELPVIARIARGSLINKLAFILPAGLLLSYFLPGAITPILMAGGTYLCFEGVEKILESLKGDEDTLAEEVAELSSAEHERQMVSGAVRTDLILSAEIMAIALAEVSQEAITMQAGILLVVAIAITIGVYGVVGFIVKMDDIGLHMAQKPGRVTQAVGRGLVHAMPKLLAALSIIGVAAMIWVGGGIVVHGLHEFHLTPVPDWINHAASSAAAAVPGASGLVEWLVHAIGSGIFGTIIGGVVVGVHHLWVRRKG
jgi:predicted DNA repair protein MutK